jgi:predicted RNase H-like nuclease
VSHLAGVDGCRRGWVVATPHGVRVVARFADVAAAGFDAIGVDMPIGLPQGPVRQADEEARAWLGRRGSSVFAAPPRPLVHLDQYAAANAASRALFGRGITCQSFNLFAKVREVDAVVERERQDSVVEIHPECSLRLLTDGVLAPKRTVEGVERRRAALEAVFGPIEVRQSGAAAHDVLDAYAVLWSVQRFAAGGHRTFGGTEVDARGLVMRICA